MRFRSKRTSRPVEASAQKANRSASVPNDGMPSGKSRRVVFSIAFGHLRLHQPLSALGYQIVERNAVDEIERVEAVAAALRHLLALGVAHETGDVDLAERHLTGEVQRHHDHPGDPEEDDVVAGDQHVGRVIRLEFDGFLRPTERAERPQRRREPRFEHVVVRSQREVGGEFVLVSHLRFVAADVDVAARVVPGRDAMSPPLLAADAPVADVAHPREVQVLVLLRHELDLAAFDHFDGRFRERRDRDEPLVRQPGFDDRAGAVAARHHQLVRFDLVDQAGGFEIGDDALARNGAVEPAIRGGNDLVEVRVGSEDVDHRQAVPLAHLVVVEVVRRRDLHAAAAERRIDIRVGDDRNFARQPAATERVRR